MLANCTPEVSVFPLSGYDTEVAAGIGRLMTMLHIDFSEAPIPASTMQEIIDSDHHEQLVATRAGSGEVIGAATMTRSFGLGSEQGFLGAFVVDESARGSGAAAELWRAMGEWGGSFSLETEKARVAAIRFYEKQGATLRTDVLAHNIPTKDVEASVSGGSEPHVYPVGLDDDLASIGKGIGNLMQSLDPGGSNLHGVQEWLMRVSSSPSHELVIAELDKLVVGAAVVSLVLEPVLRYGLLSAFEVLPEARGMGVESGLLQSISAWSRQNRIDYVEAVTPLEDQTTIDFYESNGGIPKPGSLQYSVSVAS